MLVIMKKELKTFFATFAGYSVLGSLVFLTALFFVMNNVMYASPDYSYTLSSTTIIFLILIPMITMRSFAEEARQRTDQLIYTSPVSVGQIVLGKFLGATILFLIGMAVTVIFPFILSMYGNVPFAKVAGSYVGYVLLGISFISVGLFVSSFTNSQVVASVLSFGVLLILFTLQGLLASFPTDRMSSVLFLAVISAIVGYLIYDSTKNIYAGVAVAVLAVASIAIVYFAFPSILDGAIIKVLQWFSLLSRFNNFSSGVLYVSDIIYYLSFSAAFVYLTYSNIEKRRWK